MIRHIIRRLAFTALVAILMIRRLSHAIRHAVMVHLVPLLLWPLGYLRSVHQIVFAWPEGPIVLGPRIALLCHFDLGGRVRPDLIEHITCLQESGFSVVLVSNSGHLSDDSLAQLRPLCAAILVRRNIGYDFCAWRDALEYLHLPCPLTERILLINDSIYGPVAPLAPILSRIEQTRAGVVALTDSQQIAWHLQSYFLSFSQDALHSSAWGRFWDHVRPVPSKQWIINNCEIGLTTRFRRAGLRCTALWPVAGLLPRVETASLEGPSQAQAQRVLDATRHNHAINPTHDLWRLLLESGFPFIKRELLRDNPSRVIDIGEWQDVARRRGATGLDCIESDLRVA